MTASTRRQPAPNASDPAEIHVIDDVRQLDALRSPVRQQLVTVLEDAGASSVGELADRIGMAAESLYYHVHALVRAGLLRQAGERRGAKRPEILYEAVAQRFVIDPENRSAEYLGALANAGAAALRSAERDYRRALVEVEAHGHGRERATDLRQLTVRLRPEAIDGLRKRLEAVVAYALEHDAADGYPCSITTALCRTSRERAR